MTVPGNGSFAYFHPPGGVVALAHRGFSLDGLENSMAAFGAAVDLGFGYVETDAHATSDGVAVALHDASLDRTTDANGLVADLPWSQVHQAKIGGVEPVPSLEDVLGTWPHLRVNIDVKAMSGAGPTARAIDRTGAHDRVCVTSFSRRRRRATVRALRRPIATSTATGEVAAFLAAARVRSDPAARHALRDVQALQIPVRYGRVTVIDRATLAAAHRAGRQVHVWTINTRPQMARLLDLGVDGIVTDRADLLRDELIARGRW